jgi:hypothetical protein
MVHEKFTAEELELKASSIMESFNFEKILKHMQDTNHQWHMGNGVMRVPDMEDIRVSARSLLTQAIYDKSQCTNIGTGGFVAYKLPWGLQLTFQLGWAGH